MDVSNWREEPMLNHRSHLKCPGGEMSGPPVANQFKEIDDWTLHLAPA